MKIKPTYIAGALLAAVLLLTLPLPKPAHIVFGVAALLLAGALLTVLVYLERNAAPVSPSAPVEEPGDRPDNGQHPES